LDIAVTIEMIFVLTKAFMLGRLDMFKSLAVTGIDLKAAQKEAEWIIISIISTTEPRIKLSCSTKSVIQTYTINNIRSSKVLFKGSSKSITL
jgi:hypothetical protein